MNVSLQLKFNTSPRGRKDGDGTSGARSDALFVAGTNCDEWLEEILHWQVPVGALRLRVVPACVGTVASGPLGVVVTGFEQPPRVHRAQPWQLVGDSLFIPREGQLFPAVSDDELTHLLISDSIQDYAWHPLVGLIGYEADHLLTVDQLLSVPLPDPEHTEKDWMQAVPGIRLNRRLHSVQPTEELRLRDIFGDGQDDIGTLEDLTDAPHSPDEASERLASARQAGRQIMRPFAKLAKWLADRRNKRAGDKQESKSPKEDDRTSREDKNKNETDSDHRRGGSTAGSGQGTGSGNVGNWIQSMGEWANKVLNHGGVSETKRLNELKRLMNMLKFDPDKGLRYAIPFGGGGGAHRGISPPTNSLSPRDVQFGAGGSGPADHWDMPWEIQAQLRQQYRELALRETQLGRHRRAAYIYAELLDDEVSAARVLEQGRFYREAAVVYQDRLKQPRKAADCFRKAGMWSEAVTIFESVGDWESTAKLYEELGEEEHARRAWLKMVCIAKDNGNYVEAAEVIETRLHDTDGAIECLDHGWIWSSRPGQCLQKAFALLGKISDHQGTRDRIEKLDSDQQAYTNRELQAAQTLAAMTREYPDGEVRRLATDVTRRIISRNLNTSAKTNGPLLATLQSLNPDDRLLTRDCNRFTSGQETQRDKRTQRSPRCRRECRIQLDKKVNWVTATNKENQVFVAGLQDDQLMISSVQFGSVLDGDGIPASHANAGSNHSVVQPQYTKWYVPAAGDQVFMEIVPNAQTRPLLVHMIGMPDQKDFTAKSSVIGKLVRNSPAQSTSTRAVAVSSNSVIWALKIGQDGLFVHGYGSDGIPTAVHNVPLAMSIDLLTQELISGFGAVACVGSRVCLTIGRRLIVMSTSTDSIAQGGGSGNLVIDATMSNESTAVFDKWDLSQPVHELVSCDAERGPRMAATYAEGGTVFWVETGEQQSFGLGLTNPIATFTPQNDLLVIDEHGVIEIYRTTSHSVDLQTTLAPYRSRPISIHSLPTRRFCVCYADGTVDVHQYQ